MKLVTLIAAFTTVLTILIPAGKTQKAKTTIAPTTFIKKSECLMVAPSFNGRCNYVLVTSGGSTTNIHFTRDRIGSQSMSFIILNSEFNPNQEEIKTVDLIINNPGPTQINKTGNCMTTGAIWRCMTRDGQYSAAAAN